MDRQHGAGVPKARYYYPTTARFMTKDTWGGDINQPMSYNAWLYGYGNPIRFTGPSGQEPQPTDYDETIPVLATLLIRSNFWQMAVLRALKSGIMLVNPETDLSPCKAASRAR